MTTLQKDNADTKALLKSHEAQIVILKADTAALKLKATTLSNHRGELQRAVDKLTDDLDAAQKARVAAEERDAA